MQLKKYLKLCRTCNACQGQRRIANGICIISIMDFSVLLLIIDDRLHIKMGRSKENTMDSDTVATNNTELLTIL